MNCERYLAIQVHLDRVVGILVLEQVQLFLVWQFQKRVGSHILRGYE